MINIQEYYKILSVCSTDSYEQFVKDFECHSTLHWTREYKKRTQGPVDVTGIPDKGYTFWFDDYEDECYDDYYDVNEPDSSSRVRKEYIHGISRTTRVFAACGRALGMTPGENPRDTYYQKVLYGDYSKKPHYQGYDKGHIIAHGIGGSLDQNLYPQKRSLNRGWTTEGKLYRAMENYILRNPGIFVFCNMQYDDNSMIPAYIEYGFITRNLGFAIEEFNNKVGPEDFTKKRASKKLT